MLKRFTETANAAVKRATNIAAEAGEQYISTEHLLLGLIGIEGTIACRVLAKMNMSLERIRSEVTLTPSGDRKLSPSEMLLAPRGKRVIDLAYDNARQLNNPYIGTEHLLLGLIRERDGMAGQALFRLGIKHAETFKRVEEAQKSDQGAEL